MPFLSRMVFGDYDELYIVSPETSPSGSLADNESRAGVSPTNSWGTDSHVESGAAA